MVRVPEPKEISVWAPEILGWQNNELYPNRNIQVTKIRVYENFGSIFSLPNNAFFSKMFFPYFA